MKTNSEILLDSINNKILCKIKNLDSCVYFPGIEIEHIFFNELTDIVYQVSFKYSSITVHEYDFFRTQGRIIKTNTDNKFLCVDWYQDEFIILKHKLSLIGVEKYEIIPVEFKQSEEESEQYGSEDFQLFYLKFEDAGDSAAFEVYFQKLFSMDDVNYKDTFIKLLKDKKLLE